MCHRTDVDTQLSKIRAAWRPLLAKLLCDLCRPSPIVLLCDGFGRTGRTIRCSRRRDLGRLAGWGVGEVSVSAVLVRAAELLR